MAHARKNQLTPSPEWAKHLRPWGKRVFWRGERKAHRAELKREMRAKVKG